MLILPQITVVGQYVANAVQFDGSNDWLERDGDFSGIANGKEFLFSCWFYKTGGGVLQLYIGDGGGLDINIDNNEALQVSCYDAGVTAFELVASSSNGVVSLDTWYHLAISCDMTNSSNRHVYLTEAGNTPASLSMSWAIYNNDTLGFSRSDHAIGAAVGGSGKCQADLADLYLDLNYLDLSTGSNLAKLIDSDGKPVNLGADGSAVTGSQPILFLSGSTASWHTNKGSGGGMTENGALTDSATSPSG